MVKIWIYLLPSGLIFELKLTFYFTFKSGLVNESCLSDQCPIKLKIYSQRLLESNLNPQVYNPRYPQHNGCDSMIHSHKIFIFIDIWNIYSLLTPYQKQYYIFGKLVKVWLITNENYESRLKIYSLAKFHYR
jgi:hypothetical protein